MWYGALSIKGYRDKGFLQVIIFTVMEIELRKIEPGDNRQMATIIRSCLEEFGANKPGTVYFDPTTDALSELFNVSGSKYFVAVKGAELLGGGGYFLTKKLPPHTCELVKLYVAGSARGIGLGKLLMEKCLSAAKEEGYEQIYLESMPELLPALHLYNKYGFQKIQVALGDSGHGGCSIFMLKSL